MRKTGFLLLLAVLLLGCDSKQVQKVNEDLQKQFTRTRDKAEQLTRQDRDEYRKKVEQEIVRMQNRLSDLKRQQGGRKTNPGYDTLSQIKDLEEKIAGLRKKNDEVQKSSQDRWEELKKHLDQTVQDVQKKIDSLSD